MSRVDTARAAWGADIPHWVIALAKECDASSQNKVATAIGWSAAAISQVLRRKYPGDVGAIEEAFKGVFQGQTVRCPALGELPTNECQQWREKAKKFSNSNSQRVRMFQACSRCQINKKDKADD